MLKDKEPTEISNVIQAKIEGKIPFTATGKRPQQIAAVSEKNDLSSCEKVMYTRAKYTLYK